MNREEVKAKYNRFDDTVLKSMYCSCGNIYSDDLNERRIIAEILRERGYHFSAFCWSKEGEIDA